jgi:hypothetical protein
MLTLGTWLAPIAAAIVVVVGIPTGLRWRSRHRLAVRRITERLAYTDSWERGCTDECEKYLEHYLGGPGRDSEDARHGRPSSSRTLRRWRGGQLA